MVTRNKKLNAEKLLGDDGELVELSNRDVTSRELMVSLGELSSRDVTERDETKFKAGVLSSCWVHSNCRCYPAQPPAVTLCGSPLADTTRMSANGRAQPAAQLSTGESDFI